MHFYRSFLGVCFWKAERVTVRYIFPWPATNRRIEGSSNKAWRDARKLGIFVFFFFFLSLI